MNTAATKPQTCFKVLLVEDHPMFREHLGQLINRDLGMEVCGETDNVTDAFRCIQETRPDITILDLTLRGSNGLELLKNLKAHQISSNILVLSMHAEEIYAERSLRAGARGYITKNEASSEVVHAIRQVMAGHLYVSQSLNARIVQRRVKKPDPSPSNLDGLADRELEVFSLLGRGKSTREIAAALHIGESTVETYRSRIKEKLHLRSTAELYLWASQWVRDHEG